MALVDSFLPPVAHRTHRTPVDAIYLDNPRDSSTSDRPSGGAAQVGSASGAEESRPTSSPAGPPSELQWQVSYDRESVDRFVSEIEVERARLDGEIKSARERIERARAGAADRRARVEAELGALVIAAHRELEEIELQHREILDAIAVGAQQAVAILSAAREEAAAMLATAATLATHLSGPTEVDLPLSYHVDPTPFRSLGELPE